MASPFRQGPTESEAASEAESIPLETVGKVAADRRQRNAEPPGNDDDPPLNLTTDLCENYRRQHWMIFGD